MTEGKTFSHIQVSSEDEDDVVIHVGVQGGTPKKTRRISKSTTGEIPRPQEDAKSPCSAGKAKTEKAAQPQEYQEQKMEDLTNIPMPIKQKIVLVLAFLLIIGFSVYYFFLR